MLESVKERFVRDMLAYPATECWPWPKARIESGYGWIWEIPNRRRALTHRVSYELFKGPIPEGMVVCHSCDNPPCYNPLHLWLGTHSDNHADMVAKGRHLRPLPSHCRNGHEYPENHNRRQNCPTCAREKRRAKRANQGA